VPTLRIAFCAALLAVAALSTPAGAQFVAEYPEVQSAEAARVRRRMMEDRQLEQFALAMNGWLRMPRRIAVRMAECPTSDVRWVSEQRAVEICYRMGTRVHNLLSADTLRESFAPAMFFLQLHAVAHGVIDELDLQVGGREEQAVDELVALLLMRFHDPSGVALRGITTLQRADANWAQWDFAEGHGLTAARIQNVACLVYGINARAYEPIRRAGLFPASRASQCTTAGQRLLTVWGNRLGNRLRSR
jgi:hypothetical protein